MGQVNRRQPDGAGAHLPGAAAANGRARLRRNRQRRFRSREQPQPGFVDYGACKAALLYVTKALAKQYAPAIRVNTVLPGPIWSRMGTRPGGMSISSWHTTARIATAVQRFLQDRQMPMGIGQPEDVAHAAVFLASPLARFITGAALDIGGTIRGLI